MCINERESARQAIVEWVENHIPSLHPDDLAQFEELLDEYADMHVELGCAISEPD